MPVNRDTVEEFWSYENVLDLISTARDLDASVSSKKNLSNLLECDPAQLTFCPSGRSGLTKLLTSLRHQDKQFVLVPAFNCSVVEKAILDAGFQCVPYDFFNAVGYFEWNRVTEMLSKNVAALIVTHYFGVPIDFYSILSAARRKGIAVIEDCAHALGGRIHSSVPSAVGDAAIFSFNYDKPISLGGGGCVRINSPDLFNPLADNGWDSPGIEEEEDALKSFYDWLIERRCKISETNFSTRIVNKIFNRFRKKTRTWELPTFSIGPLRAALLDFCVDRYESVAEVRNNNARLLLGDLSGFCWPKSDKCISNWLRLKVRLRDEKNLRACSKKLCSLGIRSGNFNWVKLLGNASSNTHYYSTLASRLWIDIPIHQNLQKDDLDVIRSNVKKYI